MSFKLKHNAITDMTVGTGIDVSLKKQMSIQLVYSAASTSTAKLQASINGTNYADVTGSSSTLSDTGGSVLWDNIETQAQFLKVTTTGGSVTVTSCKLSSNA